MDMLPYLRRLIPLDVPVPTYLKLLSRNSSVSRLRSVSCGQIFQFTLAKEGDFAVDAVYPYCIWEFPQRNRKSGLHFKLGEDKTLEQALSRPFISWVLTFIRTVSVVTRGTRVSL